MPKPEKKSGYASKGPGYRYSEELKNWTAAVRSNSPDKTRWDKAWKEKFWTGEQWAEHARLSARRQEEAFADE